MLNVLHHSVHRNEKKLWLRRTIGKNHIWHCYVVGHDVYKTVFVLKYHRIYCWMKLRFKSLGLGDFFWKKTYWYGDRKNIFPINLNFHNTLISVLYIIDFVGSGCLECWFFHTKGRTQIIYNIMNIRLGVFFWMI